MNYFKYKIKGYGHNNIIVTYEIVIAVDNTSWAFQVKSGRLKTKLATIDPNMFHTI